mgnify:CR=1 FL=1
MYCLYIDSSLDGVGVACASFTTNPKPIFLAVCPQKFGSAGNLSLLVKQAKAHIGGAEFDQIVITGGPGSFTGIKIGLGWLYGYVAADPTQKPMMAQTSALEAALFHLVATNDYGRDLFLYWPLTRAHGFIARYNAKTKQSSVILHEGSSTSCEFGQLNELFSQGVWIAAKQWDLFAASHASLQISRVLTNEELLEYCLLGMIGQFSGKAELFCDHLPKPNYMRKTTAEENFELKSRKD